MMMNARTSAPATAKLVASAVRKEAVVADSASTEAALESVLRGRKTGKLGEADGCEEGTHDMMG